MLSYAGRFKKIPMRGLPREPTVCCANRLLVMLGFELKASVINSTLKYNPYEKMGSGACCFSGMRSYPSSDACRSRYFILERLFFSIR